MTVTKTKHLVRADVAHKSPVDILRSPVTALQGVGSKAAETLAELSIETIYDLAHSRIFGAAYDLTYFDDSVLSEFGLIPTDMVVANAQHGVQPADLALQEIELLAGIGRSRAAGIREHLLAESIRDLALWPPYCAARDIAGIGGGNTDALADPGIPHELVPTFNAHATEKAFYTVYTIEPDLAEATEELKGSIRLEEEIRKSTRLGVRTGFVLRYEQSWTPVGLTLGSLLHSLALAPGESTRIAVVDWSRRQGVSTREDISQLESLANSTAQARSLSEITNATASEAQSGFSSTNTNTNVENTAASGFGLQNAEQALAAAGAGAAAGGTAGVVGGGVAGAGIGAFAGGITGAFGAGVGSIPGWAIGAIAGGGVGAGAGGLIGATSGGALGFLGAAEFGSDQSSGSSVLLDSVVTTSTQGEREIEAQTLQNISESTQQNSSASRSKRAAIVQEVSQRETENVSTRVVTNYNHMHALTIQYFEVVQLYRVQTTLKRRTHCVYIPFEPVKSWSAALVRKLRAHLLAASLSPSFTFALLEAEGTTVMHSADYSLVPATERLKQSTEALEKARVALDDFVSANPNTNWRVPQGHKAVFIWGTRVNGAGPFGGHDNADPVTSELVFTHATGERFVWNSETWNDDKTPEHAYRLGNLRRIDYVIRSTTRDFDLRRELVQQEGERDAPRVFTMRFDLEDGTVDAGDDVRAFSFSALYRMHSSMVEDNVLTMPIVRFDHALSMKKVIEHLNQNTQHYSMAVLRRRDNPMLGQILSSYAFEGTPLLAQVDQEPLAISGNHLVFALHRKDEDDPRTSEREAGVGMVSESDILPIPTGGVFAEAVQGRANAAERLDITRFWDWQDSPIPIVAPEIAPVSLASRAMAADVRPGSLDPALLQNLPANALPAPQGLPAIISAASSDLFRDMSGLAENVKLAQTALEQAMEGATTTGAQAADSLAKGLELTKEIGGKIVDMNSQFANELLKQGFGALSKGAGGSSGDNGTDPATTEIGNGTSSGLTALGGGNSSKIGSLLNHAREIDRRRNNPAFSNGSATLLPAGTQTRGTSEDAAFSAALGNGHNGITSAGFGFDPGNSLVFGEHGHGLPQTRALKSALVVFIENTGRIPKVFGDILNDFDPSVKTAIEGQVDYWAEEFEKWHLRFRRAEGEQYDTVAMLEDERATPAVLSDKLKVLATNDYEIDIITIGHGGKDRLEGHGGSLIEPSTLSALRSEFGGPMPIRAVYMMNCVGASMNPHWIDLGARVSGGSIDNNYIPEPMLAFFWSRWKQGDTFEAALRAAYEYSTLLWQVVFDGLELAGATGDETADGMISKSEPDVEGDGGITIGTRRTVTESVPI